MDTARFRLPHRVGLAAALLVVAVSLLGFTTSGIQRVHKWASSVPYDAVGALRYNRAADAFDMIAWERAKRVGVPSVRSRMSAGIAVSLADPAIRLPSEGAAGQPVEALPVASRVPRAKRVLIVRFESGIQLEARPGWTEQRLLDEMKPENGARSVRDVVAPHSVRASAPRASTTEISGVQAIVVTPGAIEGVSHASRRRVPAQVRFVKDSIRYRVYSSYDTSAERLQRVAASIIEQP